MNEHPSETTRWPMEMAWRERVRRSPIISAIIVACVLAFATTLALCWREENSPGIRSLWNLAGCEGVLVELGGLRLSRVWDDGEWWRVATAALLHGSWLHLLLNLASLWVVGEWAEWVWGSVRTLVVFLLAAAGGGLASLAWAEAPMVVGASGGVLGIAGGLLAAKVMGTAAAQQRLAPLRGRALAGSLIVLLILGTVVPVMAQAGHIGGLWVGTVVGAALSAGTVRKRTLLWTAVFASLIGGSWWAQNPLRSAREAEILGFSRLDQGDAEAAVAAFETALHERPDDPELANAVAYALAEAGVDLDRAAVLVARALRAEPKNVDYLDTWGWILCRQGHFGHGQRVLRLAQSLAAEPVSELDEHLGRCRGSSVVDVPRE